MKIEDKETFKIWGDAEKILTQHVSPEHMRTSGLISAQLKNWNSSLLRLEEAVRNGIHDWQTLDSLGEAAYRASMPEALLPIEQLYQNPIVAIHMARALIMLGDLKGAEEYLKLAPETMLKAAIKALLGFKNNIESSMAAMFLPVTQFEKEIKNLNYIEYWQALAPIADAAKRSDLVRLAERRLKALAYERPVHHYNQALRLLMEGEYSAGWKLYDWYMVPGSPCADKTEFGDLPLWEGENLKNKKLLVILANGAGDQIFSVRYLRALLEEGAQIEVAVDKEIRPLLELNYPTFKFHDRLLAEDKKYWTSQLSAKSLPDYWVYSFSIPARADLCQPIQTKGFLCSPPLLALDCQAFIKTQNPNALPIFGLTWHGKMLTPSMRTRAYTISEFLAESKILEKPRVIICLQKDATEDELIFLQAEVHKSGGIFINAANTLIDYAQTAAWMSTLDQMFSCDTVTAHLAGALAVPTTALIRNRAIWHWRCEDDFKSVWYDSVKVQFALDPKISYMFEMRTDLT